MHYVTCCCCSCCLQYYSLDITFFKSSMDVHMLDLLWNKYWVSTISASPLLSNREFAGGKVRQTAAAHPFEKRGGFEPPPPPPPPQHRVIVPRATPYSVTFLLLLLCKNMARWYLIQQCLWCAASSLVMQCIGVPVLLLTYAACC